ncbi:hypothetical protein MBLNU230_g0119t1 [Neophaeotheca triangularis]
MKTTAVLATALTAASGAFGKIKKRQQGSLPPVTTRGNAFYAGGERFYMRGVAYQPGGAADAADPLLDMPSLRRDIENFQELGVNTIRIYTIDNSGDHDEAMQMLDEAGIYLALDANTPDYSLLRGDNDEVHTSYNSGYLENVFATIDAFAGYSNLALFFSGNEVINAANNSNTAPYVKAVQRDMKRYIGAQSDRQIPVGYSAADDLTELQAQYFICGDDDNARADFFALNDYSWCDPSSFEESGWNQKVETYSDYPVPLFLSEFGCITNTREWGEVASLYHPNMTGVYSGGLAYEYTVEPNGYGLVDVEDGEVVTNDDFDRLAEAFAAVDNPSGDGGARLSTNGSWPECPSQSDEWKVSTDNLPEIPEEAEEMIQDGVDDAPGLDGPGSQFAGAGELSQTDPDLGDGVTESETTGDGNSAGSDGANDSSSGSSSSSDDDDDDEDDSSDSEGAAPKFGAGIGLVGAITFAFMLL